MTQESLRASLLEQLEGGHPHSSAKLSPYPREAKKKEAGSSQCSLVPLHPTIISPVRAHIAALPAASDALPPFLFSECLSDSSLSVHEK